jgi:hypothetical protein
VRFVLTAAQVARAHAAGKRVFLAGPGVSGKEPENWRQARESSTRQSGRSPADAGAGEVAVGVLDEAGRPLAGYAGQEAASARRIDQVRWQPRWKGHPDLSALRGQTVRLQFTLRNANLYAFRVQ